MDDTRKAWTGVSISTEMKLSGDERISVPEESQEPLVEHLKEPFMAAFAQAYKEVGKTVKEGKIPNRIEMVITLDMKEVEGGSTGAARFH